ncbi:hypothetical protein NHP194003_13450 [Helicobacter suis]|uniref:DUF2018 family protein n=1 Tax=Helicobacter suis TaxID=104628 RepID=UPI001596FB27|nr:DUF2018 family protein [Helicobacter suis]BCD48141.1 hypothetical protein NHP194003_13450 [Helicobacter suis]
MDDLEVFEGDPLEKWAEVIVHASFKRSFEELDKLLETRALCELLLEEEGFLEKFNALSQQNRLDSALQDRIHARKVDLAIDSMARILSGHE